MYICIYICMYICMHVYVFMYVYSPNMVHIIDSTTIYAHYTIVYYCIHTPCSAHQLMIIFTYFSGFPAV